VLAIVPAVPSPACGSAATLLLATDDPPCNPWIMDGGRVAPSRKRRHTLLFSLRPQILTDGLGWPAEKIRETIAAIKPGMHVRPV